MNLQAALKPRSQDPAFPELATVLQATGLAGIGRDLISFAIDWTI